MFIKSYGSYQPARAFIPVNERKTTAVTSHHQRTLQSAPHAHHSSHGHSTAARAHTTTVKAHKPLPHHVKHTN
ncbi:hypothetical protein KBF38_06130 [bacterium]|nr:hypothetical protein [bacterium]